MYNTVISTSEAGQLRSQMSGMLSQQSTSDRVMREVQQREIDLQVSFPLIYSQ